MQLQTSLGSPAWDDGREQRLFVSMLLATIFVAAALSLMRLPAVLGVAPFVSPIVSLIVRIVRDDLDKPIPADAKPAESTNTEALPANPASGQSVSLRPQPGEAAGVPDEAPQTDWRTPSDEAIPRYLDSLENPYSVNPSMDARRRELAGRYQPATRDRPKPIWENAEKDQLGRTVLRSGDCYKVIDDPNVGSRYAFEEFGQYIVMCEHQEKNPRVLPWVADTRERYHYLKYADGYVPDE